MAINSESSPSPSATPPSSTSTSATTPSPSSASPYPYAFAPDIIRAHQKDAYFQGLLTNQVTDLHRRLLGARSAHAWAPESKTIADLLYLCLTTLLGNRTLGEEYCGLVQVESAGPASASRLPALPRRAAYIAASILLPYGLSKILPSIRARIRARLQRNLARSDANNAAPGGGGVVKSGGGRKWTANLQAYLLANLTSITSPAALHALSLALFYFGGSYYELAKRLTGLRYIFTQRVEPSADRAGYEVLGLLLVVQMAVQGYLHVSSTLNAFSSSSSSSSSQTASDRERTSAYQFQGGTYSLDENAYTTNNSLLTPAGAASASSTGAQPTRIDVALATHTPPVVPAGTGDQHQQPSTAARYDLAEEGNMRWIRGAQQRKCTLCLEELKDPSATPCGHVFCWACIGDWVREKPECPLCRREALVQHILPLRAV
ncbi:Pex12 amino terminal region-domain-containing protein [Xylariomycetidae sp. FL2044]|nr:Pex12 amino terminal region-domain-containing protein [Xylariomycetidae sp. FL2044]